tara:strand:+ start:107 stop:2845 length:2739 start_codon:yes stop_codon:yes gene_type:complete
LWNKAVLSLGFLSFNSPWVLIGFLALPLIWWLLQLYPPAPTRIVFPPIILLRRLISRQESPSEVPLWLFVLRLLAAVAFIFALAHPLINSGAPLKNLGPVYLIVDDDWASAGRWQVRRATMINFIERAARDDRSVVIVRTAIKSKNSDHEMIKKMSPEEAKKSVEALLPRPWHTDRAKAVKILLDWWSENKYQPGDVVWVSNSVEYFDPKIKAPINVLVRRLEQLGSVFIMIDKAGQLPVILQQPDTEGHALIVNISRPSVRRGSIPKRIFTLRAVDDQGRTLARIPTTLARGKQRSHVKISLPSELRSRLARIEVSGVNSAGGVALVDERWRLRPVAIVKSGRNIDQPLLDSQHYLRQALDPFTEVRIGEIAELLSRPLSMMIIADTEKPTHDQLRLLNQWLDKGGVLVRFAGPNLARNGGIPDPLLPVQLRRGDRVTGGSLSWGKPESLAPFPKTSPFHGLAIPKDIYVRRQVLAEPSPDLATKTWAQLRDGTPLVTAEQRGLGWLVLVHTTANGTWADLAFSGVFVEMLRRLINVSQGVVISNSNDLPPVANLDAFGKLGEPLGETSSINVPDLEAGKVGPHNPPGLYGYGQSLRALNLGQGLKSFRALGQFGRTVQLSEYSHPTSLDLKPWLLLFAAVLFLTDAACSFYIRGLFRLRSAILFFLFSLLTPIPSFAKDLDAYALANSLETRLAFVITGSKEIDEISYAGLVGLNNMLWRRTAAELGDPQGIDPKVDELAFFPLLYWPVISDFSLDDKATRRVRRYLRNGGTIFFDKLGATIERTVDFDSLARQLALPRLLPIDSKHVLGRSFYLLREFPGRWTGDTLWIEKAGERTNDGVSRIIVGNHDWISAWAMDDRQRPIFAVVPGGERQREMAFRFGINLVMYALTGNYKADQVHLPEIIRRLGE